MDVKNITDQAHVQKWKKIIQECSNSGEPIYKWCEAHNVTISCYYKWLKKFKEEAFTEAGIDEDTFSEKREIVPLPVNTLSLPAEEPAPVPAVGKIRITKDGASIEIDNGTDEALVRMVLKAII